MSSQTAGSIGRILWTYLATIVSFIVWAAAVAPLIQNGSWWGYALVAFVSLVFLGVLLSLRRVWREPRFW
jgi:hypothetical protein